MSEYRFHLQKYRPGSKTTCPSCGKSRCFVRYIDEQGSISFPGNVGKCDHENSCGYHYTPKQFFIDNPVEKEHFVAPVQQKPIQKLRQEASYIPFQYVEKSVSYNSSFVYFLCGLFDCYTLESPTIEKIMQDYALGATKDGSVIYWQI